MCHQSSSLHEKHFYLLAWIGCDYMTYMDYMDLTVPRKAVKSNHSLTHY